MGFWSRIFGGGVDKKEINFSELDVWLEEEDAKSSSEIVGETKPVIMEILECKARIREKVLEIERLPYDDLPAKLRNIMRTSKPEYVSSMLGVLDGISLSDKADYRSIIDFQKNFSDSLERIAKITLSHGRYLPFAYGDAVDVLQKEVKSLIDANRKLNEKLGSYNRISSLKKIKTSKGDFEASAGNKKTVDSAISVLKKDLKELDNGLTKAEAEHKKLLEDKQISKLRKEIEETVKKKEDIKTLVSHNLASINKPLRKYKRLAIAEKRLPQAAEDSIDGYIENPFEQFLSNRQLETILTDMEKAIGEGKIEIKNPEKAGRTIKDIKANLTPPLVDDYNALSEREKQIADEIRKSDVLHKIEGVEVYIEQLENKILVKTGELEALGKKSRELEDKMDNTIKQLQNQLNEFNAVLLTGK